MRQGDGLDESHHRSGWGTARRPEPTRLIGDPHVAPPTGAVSNDPYQRTSHWPTARQAHQSPVLGGRYRLTGQLGAAAPADSHRGIDERLNRPVAVTLFPHTGDRAGERRFRNEAQALANLNHPGLVAVYDFAVEQTCAYVVTELVEGSTLRGLLDRECLPAAEVSRIGADIANALAYLHDHGLVHGHLSPSSVVLDPSRGARLTGFGLAPLLEATGCTSLHVAAGQAAYSAPEQVRGRRPDAPADIYGLGMLLLAMLTGGPGHAGSTRATTPRPPSYPPAIPSDVGDPLRRVLRDMTDAAPASRPTARQVEAMLAPVDPSIDAGDEMDRAHEESRGSTTGLAIGLGLVVLLAVLVGAALVSWQDTSEPTQPAAPATTAQDPANEPDVTAPILPAIPSFEAPDLPEMPSLPTAVPDVPDSVSEDARGLWTEFMDWLSRTF